MQKLYPETQAYFQKIYDQITNIQSHSRLYSLYSSSDREVMNHLLKIQHYTIYYPSPQKALSSLCTEVQKTEDVIQRVMKPSLYVHQLNQTISSLSQSEKTFDLFNLAEKEALSSIQSIDALQRTLPFNSALYKTFPTTQSLQTIAKTIEKLNQHAPKENNSSLIQWFLSPFSRLSFTSSTSSRKYSEIHVQKFPGIRELMLEEEEIIPSEEMENKAYATNASEILPNSLFLGNIFAYVEVAEQDNPSQFARVISVLSLEDKPHQTPPSKHFKIPVSDIDEAWEDLVKQSSLSYIKNDATTWFSAVFQFIDEGILEGEKVLVHCQGGISRSASLVIAYLMNRFGVSFEQALKYVQNQRLIINPNLGFRKGLQEYDSRLSKR